MNKGDYVSLEVAKLLEEKGFNEVCDAGYFIEDKDIIPFHYGICQNSGECYVAGYIGAPTLYEAAKWLREKGIFIEVAPHYSRKYEIIEYEYKITDYFDLLEKQSKGKKSKEYYEKYEQCLNNAIFEALKFI